MWPRPTFSTPSRSRGLSLVELVISMVLVGILAAAVSTPMRNAVTARTAIATARDGSDATHYALQRIARELRETLMSGSAYAYLLSPQGGNGSASNTSSGLCFVRRWGADGNSTRAVQVLYDAAAKRITTASADNATDCNSVGTASTLMDNAAALQFTYWYYDGNGALQPLPLGNGTFGVLVRRIDIAVKSAVGTNLARSTTVFLRNGL